jgi:FMN phosphatase YigB (HAD superfamily)
VREQPLRVVQIDTVVFDIGRVLVRLDFSRILAYFARHGLDPGSIDLLLERIELGAYERGDFDGDELLRRIAALGDGGMSVDELREHWLGMFLPERRMIELARGLAASRRVYLLSNIGDLHWHFLSREIDIASIGHGALPSFQARACKPDPAIYRKAEQLFGLEPARTVFIDDLLANVDTARQRGWHAIHHLSPAATLRDLEALGVTEAPQHAPARHG